MNARSVKDVKTTSWIVGLAVAGVGCLGGCGTGGAWTSEGFSQKTYGWKASYPPGKSTLLGDDWRVDNWEKTAGSQNPSDTAGTNGAILEKTGPGYTVDFDEDGNENGKIDAVERGRKYLYDLKLAHVADDAFMWIKTRELSPDDGKKSLEMLVERYLHSSRLSTSLVGVGFSVKAVTGFAETNLGANRALAVSIEAGALATQTGEMRRIDLYFTKFVYDLPPMADAMVSGVGAEGSSTSQPRAATAFMVLGYVNAASRFEASRGDFEALVSRMSWPSASGAIVAAGDDEEGDSRWTATGFEQRRYGWKVKFAAGRKDFLGADWRLHEGADEESGYTGTADLSFENVHNNGFIWTDTSTLATDTATKDLDVLFENYVGRLSNVGFNGHAVISSREQILLGAYPAVSATIEREPTQAERDGHVKTIATKLRLVVAKFDFVDRPAKPGAVGERSVAFMVVGYANDSKRFDGGLEDFVRFLERITWPPPPKGVKPPPAPTKDPARVDPDQPGVQS